MQIASVSNGLGARGADFPGSQDEGAGGRGHTFGSMGFAASGPFHIVKPNILGYKAWMPQ